MKKKFLLIILSVMLTSNLIYVPSLAQEDTVENLREMKQDDEDISNHDAMGFVDESENVKEDAEEGVEKDVESEKKCLTNVKVEQIPNDGFKLSWEKNEETAVDGYQIKIFSNEEMTNQQGESIDVSDASTLEYQFTPEIIKNFDLANGVIYYIKIIPYEVVEGEQIGVEEVFTSIILLNTPVVTLKAEDAQITLTWKKIAGATLYEIYDVSAKKVVMKTTDNTCKIKKLKNNKKYTYQVRAIASFEEYEMASDYSDKISGKPLIAKPGTVNLSVKPANKAAVLSWKSVKGATSYYVYRYNSSKKSWVRIAHVKKTEYKNSGLKSGSTYYYKVAAVRTSGDVTAVGTKSNKVSLKAKAYVTGAVHAMYYNARLTRKAAVYSNKTSKEIVKYLKKGTKVTVVYVGKRAQVRLANGEKCWVAKMNVQFLSCIYTTKDYTKDTKEEFVNNGGYSSKTSYLIWISSYTQRVNIFKGKKGKWKLTKTCRVATGNSQTRTPRGVYKITYREKGWYYTNTCVKKIVHFAGRNSFHSRIYRYDGSLSDATIGRPASHGCVRMYMDDINYIYNKMPIGTTVISL